LLAFGVVADAHDGAATDHRYEVVHAQARRSQPHAHRDAAGFRVVLDALDHLPVVGRDHGILHQRVAVAYVQRGDGYALGNQLAHRHKRNGQGDR